jgi:reactive intermediate/imine deaminase
MTMKKSAVHYDPARAAVGANSEGIRVGDTVYISGQLGLDPVTGTLADTIDAQANQAFKNVRAIAQAAGGDLDGIVKLTLLMADLDDFAKVNEIMTTFFTPPYPARATYQVAALPKAGRIEVEAVLVLPSIAPSAQTGWRETFDATKAA